MITCTDGGAALRGSLNATYPAAALAPHARRSRSGSFAPSRRLRLEFRRIGTIIDYWESEFDLGTFELEFCCQSYVLVVGTKHRSLSRLVEPEPPRGPGAPGRDRRGSAGTYAKMFSALQAGNAPDLGQIEYDVLPNFEHVGGLSDISSCVKAYKGDFLGWTWNQVSVGSAVYAIPQDIGPMGLFYRADLFKQYGLTVPTTWQGFLADAQKLHAANPNLYLATFSLADTGWFVGLAWQAGANWFSTSGSSWVVHLASSASEKVASLWQEMISQQLVKVEPDFTSGWNKDFAT